MSRASNLAKAIGADGTLNVSDVAGLAAVASSGSASDLSTGTLPNARLATGAAVANLGYTPVNKAGDTFTGTMQFHSTGTAAFANGTGDNATYSTYNFKLAGWNGMAIYNESSSGTYPNQPCGMLNFRQGVLDMKGGFFQGGVPVLTSAAGTEASYNQYTVMSANTAYKIGQLQAGVGMYAIFIRMDSGVNSNGDNIYWESAWGAVVGAIGSNLYNAAPTQPLAVSATYHHRTVGEPTFYIDSDNSSGNYGNQSVYVTFPQYTNVQGMQFYYKKLM